MVQITGASLAPTRRNVTKEPSVPPPPHPIQYDPLVLMVPRDLIIDFDLFEVIARISMDLYHSYYVCLKYNKLG